MGVDALPGAELENLAFAHKEYVCEFGLDRTGRLMDGLHYRFALFVCEIMHN